VSRLAELRPGDICAVRSPWTIWGWLIRLGAVLSGRSGRCDHVVVVVGWDATGGLCGVEGRPSGVGHVSMRRYDNRWISSNSGQPKTDNQRRAVVDAALAAVGTSYDWLAIAADALDCLGVPQPIDGEYRRQPRSVVCSSLANYVCWRAGVDHPGVGDRWCTPADWDEFNRNRVWLALDESRQR
jgi:hypothetical protein